MSEPQLPLYEPDEATLARDEALLDALGNGIFKDVDDVPGEDTIAMAMFMWREDLSAPPKAVAAERARRRKRRFTWSVIAAALAASLGTGATLVTTNYFEPGGPLFPIVEFVNPGQASAASADAAEERIADAQTAVDEKHLPEAKKLLDEAETLIASVIDLLEKERLLAEVQRIRAVLSDLLGIAPVPTPAPVPSPGSTPGGNGPAAPTPTPSPARSGGGVLPLPLPTISLPPLPTLPLG